MSKTLKIVVESDPRQCSQVDEESHTSWTSHHVDFTAVLQPCLVHIESTPIPEEDRCHNGEIVEFVHDTVQMFQTKTLYSLA